MTFLKRSFGWSTLTIIIKKLTLFSCDCFDPIMNRGIRVHPLYRIVKIKHNRMYPKYDPFIFAQQGVQFYYTL